MDLNMALLISNQMLQIVRFLHLIGQLVQDRTRLAVEKHASHLRHIVFLGLKLLIKAPILRLDRLELPFKVCNFILVVSGAFCAEKMRIRLH